MKLQYIKQTCAGHLRLKRGPWVLESYNQASPSWWEQPIGKCQGPSGLKKLPENRWQRYWIQIWVKTVLYNLLAIGCWSHKLTFLSLNLSSCKMRLNVYIKTCCCEKQDNRYRYSYYFMFIVYHSFIQINIRICRYTHIEIMEYY